MKVKPLALALVFIVALTFGIHLLRSNATSSADYPRRVITTSEVEVIVEIPAGATGSDVGRILFNKGVVKSAAAYFGAAVSDKKSEQVSPGNHRLSRQISATQALEQLLDPNRIPNLIKVFEGAWESEVMTSMIKYGFAPKEVSAAFKKVVLPKGFDSSEGLLFPAQYSFSKGTTALQVVQAMIDRFRGELTGQEILNAKGEFTPLQLLTVASIVQAESDSVDFDKVSRVIFNRLKISMPLQMDSTVHFLKKVRGQIFLSTDSTLIKSPYNTYQHYGLPPTPIGNPGIKAMQAALNPVSGDWLYFITVSPGDTRFTASNSEFNTWKVLYEKNRLAGAFK